MTSSTDPYADDGRESEAESPYANAGDGADNRERGGETDERVDRDEGEKTSSGSETPPPDPDPDPERDCDLAPVAGAPALGPRARAVVHAIHWPVYLLVVFPLQWVYHGLRHPTAAQTVRATVRGFRRLAFFADRNRATLYLRSSWVLTPALYPFMPGTSPVTEDPTVPRNGGLDESRRRAVLRRDDYVCQNCGAGGGPHGDAVLQVDHATPRSRGGSDRPENLRTLCRPCHEARHGRRFD